MTSVDSSNDTPSNRPHGVSRGQFLRVMALGAAAIGASSCNTDGSGSRRPNIVMIFADDLVYRAVGYSNPIVRTPNIDRLAQSGIIFDRCYVGSPICVASRASVMSGVFPQQHGSVALDAAGFRQAVVESRRLTTFPQRLSEAKYRTALFGKSHLGDPISYGFAEGAENQDPLDIETFRGASEFLQARRDDTAPFLMWLAPHQPHVPLIPAQEWLDLYRDVDILLDPNFRETPPPGSIYNQGKPGEQYYRDSTYTKNYRQLPSGPPRSAEQMKEFIRAYYATLSHLDHQIGAFVEELKACGHYDDTIIFFCADNGYHLGNHGLGNKITMHEESVRVPLFVHSPRLRKSGARTESLVSTLDFYPTFLELAGLPASEQAMGRSLVPLLDSPRRTVQDHVVAECVGVGGKTGEGHRMVRTARWKYVLTDTNEEALFDGDKDPFELENIVEQPVRAGVLHDLRAKLVAWMNRVGDTHARPPQ